MLCYIFNQKESSSTWPLKGFRSTTSILPLNMSNNCKEEGQNRLIFNSMPFLSSFSLFGLFYADNGKNH